LGHKRLAIIDLTGGAQPMVDEERGLAIVFNGEIYNYRELNTELAALGFQAHSRSDTETLLLAYAAWGPDCLAKLNGMFAFVVHDRRRHRLFGARDRMGKKPFYYFNRNGFFAFASEPKALLQHPAVERNIDPQAAARYFLHEFVPAPYAIYKGMRKLAAGQSLLYDLHTDSLTIQTYWDMYRPETPPPDEKIPKSEWIARLRQTLEASVRRRLISDVPLGVFLSGGIDSSAVTAAMVKIMGAENVKTFSIGFSDKHFDESAHARRMAEFLGTKHLDDHLSAEMAVNILPKVISFLDEPFADPSVLPTYLLSRFARQFVTVALAGDGGDELFAGYDTFRALKFLQFYNSFCPGPLDRGLVRPLARMLPVTYGNFSLDFRIKQFLRGAKVPESQRLWRWLGSFVPEELTELLQPDALAAAGPELYSGVEELFSRVARFDSITRDGYIFARTYLADGVLAKVDRASMACALETRAPLLDHEFVTLAASIPGRLKYHNGRTKHILKESLTQALPSDILKRPKKGFGIPLGDWFRNRLRDSLQDTLHERRIREGGILNPVAVRRLVDDHLAGRRDNRKPLWTVFMFERWREQWLKKPAEAAPEKTVAVAKA
jgi:asparagine synthase (glutamine-hydrolysing)